MDNPQNELPSVVKQSAPELLAVARAFGIDTKQVVDIKLEMGVPFSFLTVQRMLTRADMALAFETLATVEKPL